MMSPLSERMELCQYNQRGFCKFGDKCKQKHENKICQHRNDCNNQHCTQRHPNLCRYFCQFGRCKFGETCAYSHVSDSKNQKEEILDKEVVELKEEMKKLKAELSEKIEKEVVKLKDDVNELNENVKFLKRVMGKLVQDIKSLEDETETESKGSSKRDTESQKESIDTKKRNDEVKFMCDKCDYTSKRKITLTKHMKTKHWTVENKNDKDNDKDNDKENSKDKRTENKVYKDNDKEKKNCDNCEKCDDCDFMKNKDTCEHCWIRFEAYIDEFDH